MAHEYRTVDSQHPDYTVPRSAWVAPVFLACFVVASVAVFSAMDELVPRYGEAVHLAAGGSGEDAPTPASLSFRPLFTLSAALFALFVAAPWIARIKLVIVALATVMSAAFLFDTLLLRLHLEIGSPSPFSLVGNIANGFAQLLALTAVIFSVHHLPSTVHVPTERRRPLRYSFVLVLAIGTAAGAATFGLTYALGHVDWLRDRGLLGGLGPGIVLFAPALQLTLFAFAVVHRRATARRRARWLREVRSQSPDAPARPSMAFLIPAHNEAETIAACLHSIGRTAADLGGQCAVYVVDNRSTDDTAEVARAALAEHPHIDAHLLYCATPGKSHALNYGLERITEDIVVRVDSDTVVAEDALARTASYFADPTIAGVGGLAYPLPHQRKRLLGRIRTLEVLITVGVVRAGQGVIDAIMVLPGQLSAYRRELITRLGGFASGINGEDTDLTVRVGRAGYRVVMDPDIRLYSEVPANIAHLREQRLRWSRSLFHVYKRHLSALWHLQGWRGLWLLPLGLLGGVRRALVLLFILYGLTSLLIAPDRLFIRDGMAIVAVIAGPHLVVMAASLVVYRRIALVPFVPGYLLLRLFRSYLAIETVLSMRHRSRVPVPRPVAEPGAMFNTLVGGASAGAVAATPAGPMRAVTRVLTVGVLLLVGAALGYGVAEFQSRSQAPPPITMQQSPAVPAGPPASQPVADPDALSARALATTPDETPAPTAEDPVATTTSQPEAVPDVAAPAEGATNETGERSMALEVVQIVVAQGDSLEAIAARYGTSVEALAEGNGITDPSRIDVGDVLEVPLDVADEPSAE